MKNKGGGIILNPNSGLSQEEAFNYFMANSDFMEISSGTAGIVFLVILRQPFRSHYVSFNKTNFAEEVREIVIKISVLGENNENIYYKEYNDIRDKKIKRKKMIVIDPSVFQKEVDFQKEIVEKTVKYLRPISPCIVFSSLEFVPPPNVLSLLNLKFPVIEKGKLTNELPSGYYLSVIAMECKNMKSTDRFLLEDKKTTRHFDPNFIDKESGEDHLRFFYDSEPLQNALAAAIILLIELAIIGFIHGDTHLGNILRNPDEGETSLIDLGNAEKISDENKVEVERLFGIFLQTPNLSTLKNLMDYIFLLNYNLSFEKNIGGEDIFSKDKKLRDDARRELNMTVEKTYGWIKNARILDRLLPKIIDEHNLKLRLDAETGAFVNDLLTMTSASDSASSSSGQSVTCTADFLRVILTSKGKNDEGEESQSDDDEEIQSDDEAKIQSVDEGEESQSDDDEEIQSDDEAEIQSDDEAEMELAEPQQILGEERDTIISNINKQIAARAEKGLNPKSKKQLLINKKKLGIIINKFNNSYHELLDLLISLIKKNPKDSRILMIMDAIIFLTDSKSYKGGGIKSNLNDSIPLLTINKSPSNKNDKKIQVKIAEIKQIHADMAKIFADWRDEVYNIFTQPDDIKNAYYQTQTPFTILTHIMVCSGLFGPLTSGKYIDVKEEENKELYDKLNLIAGAFVTMNNGYLSMSNVKMQLMIEDAKKATITTVEKVVEGPTVEVREDIDIDKTLIGPGPAEMINREELVAGFGGNKKYSRRKRRKYSKRQRKGCRRKSNKRFYSKKVTKKRRKYSKPK